MKKRPADRIEDTVLITEKGCEVLTPTKKTWLFFKAAVAPFHE